jgi:hypothetical protein
VAHPRIPSLGETALPPTPNHLYDSQPVVEQRVSCARYCLERRTRTSFAFNLSFQEGMNKVWHGLATTGLAAWRSCPSPLRRTMLREYFSMGCASRMRSSSKPRLFPAANKLVLCTLSNRPQQMAQRWLTWVSVFYHEPVTPGAADIRDVEDRRRRVGWRYRAIALPRPLPPVHSQRRLLRFCPPRFTIMSLARAGSLVS